MNATRWQAIGNLFEQALALPAGARTALIDDECAGDADLRREVVSLLASHDAAGGFVQQRIHGALTTFHETSVANAPPARVGPYRLIRELGRGGMGTVFLAERDDDEYRARVAIKLVRPGMDTEFILARFRRERQTLARLHHPNISRLLDGGTTETGLPYFVMEFIDGPWLTVFADRHALDVDDRLRLFLDVCSAVDYAHRHFVIHRDLKPGNILVDPSGAPKLLDFGICKLLGPEALSADDTAAAPMTPNYASPEQIRGEPVTLLSDIFSLGAVLYELLTGASPRRSGSLTAVGLEQALQAPIALPSAAAANPGVSRQLRGDLDNVLLRALESEPIRRYESPAQLADDLRRYLDHEPVRARPQTLRYRASKFVRRNRVQVAAAAAVVLTLSGGLAVSMYEWRLASSRLRQIRAIADKLVFDVHDAVRDLPGSTRARQLIMQTALDYLDSSVNSVRGDAGAEKELAKAYRRLGDVQGNAQAANLGDPATALARYRQAIALVDGVIVRAPRDFDAITERLVLYERVGTLHAYTGKLRDAVQTLQDGIRAGAPFRGAGGDDLALALANLYLQSSDAFRNLNDYPGALRDAMQGLQLFQEVAARHPSDRSVRLPLANAYASVGMAESTLGRLEEALSHYRRGTEVMEQLVVSEPQNVSWNRDLMLAYGHIADVLGNPGLQNLGDRAGSLAAYRQAAAIGKRLYEADRADLRAVSDYGIVLSRVETVMDDTDPAKLEIERESIGTLEEAARISPDNVSPKIYLSLVYQQLGDTVAATGDLAAAAAAYRRSVNIAEAAMNTGHASFQTQFLLTVRRLAVNAATRGRRDEALGLARDALRAGENPATGAVPVRTLARGQSAMGLTYASLLTSPARAAGDREAALTWLGKALDTWRAGRAEPGFGEPHRREMADVEAALARVRAQPGGRESISGSVKR
jgi:tetratricopeptide (TPR) repeat protein/tRNA A-37 threonylcarbamoyl transferase component Bud32